MKGTSLFVPVLAESLRVWEQLYEPHKGLDKSSLIKSGSSVTTVGPQTHNTLRRVGLPITRPLHGVTSPWK